MFYSYLNEMIFDRTSIHEKLVGGIFCGDISQYIYCYILTYNIIIDAIVRVEFKEIFWNQTNSNFSSNNTRIGMKLLK